VTKSKQESTINEIPVQIAVVRFDKFFETRLISCIKSKISFFEGEDAVWIEKMQDPLAGTL
jgi:hypothetical protein